MSVCIVISEHIAPVLCVAATVSRSLVISGGEDSAVIVTSLVDGALVGSGWRLLYRSRHT